MQRDRFEAAALWLGNANTDLELAGEIAARYPPRACFHAQQAADMALKAALIALTDDHPRSHVADALLRELDALGVPVPTDVAAAANRLDLFYTSARYPDALGGADPREVLQGADGAAAIAQARQVLGFSESLIDGALRDGK